MKRILIVTLAAFNLLACKKKVDPAAPPAQGTDPLYTSEVNPVDINTIGFSFMENMKGHWVGENQVMAWNWDWFSFDYRPISESHIFGMYEGGTMGNLLTSFFISDFKNTRTIMARNGGVLSGIYRTSYFVLDSVRINGNEEYFRFVDAYGGSATMFIELQFKADSLNFNAYTSRLGEQAMPIRHMTFKAVKQSTTLADAAATAFNYPQNSVAWDFSTGFDTNWLYIPPSLSAPKSASFLYQSSSNDVYAMAPLSGDPFTIQDHPNIGLLDINIVRNPTIQNDNLFLYLSEQPLTDGNGILQFQNFSSIFSLTDLTNAETNFRYTYVHPGTYYVNIIADRNGDGAPGAGDYCHANQQITINPNGTHQITIDNINVQN